MRDSPSQERRHVLLLGNRRPSLAAIRSLHDAGCKLTVDVSGPNDRTGMAGV